jgi:hypothetical protein
MDRFYEWASRLQVEARNANQRLWALEKAASEGLLSDPAGVCEDSLLARLEAVKPKPSVINK